MGSAAFEKGAIIKMDGASFTLLRKVDQNDWQFEQDRTGKIVTLSEREILSQFTKGALAIAGPEAIVARGISSVELPEEQLEAAKIRRLYVLAIENVPNSRQALEEAIRAVWSRLRTPASLPAYTTAYNWKRRYQDAKGDIRALVDNVAAKGNRTSRYDPEVVSICRAAIEAKFLRRERGTIQSAVDEAIMRTTHENGLRPAGHRLRLPTRRLIKRLIDDLPAYEKHVARYGRESARRHFRSVKGHVVTEAPLQRAEMDHTILDLFVIDDVTGLPLGRPTLTVCLDDFTRCILGYYIGFTPPSYRTVAACLRQCFLPKIDVRLQHPELKNDWPSYGVMRELVIDNGREFHSNALEQVCLTLGITLEFSARREPWHKGKIERFFGTLNRDLAHTAPGTTFSNIFDKDDYDPEKQAVVPLSTLEGILRKWIVDIYHQEHHRGIDTTPAKMWNSNVRFEDIRLPDATTDIDITMARSCHRTLSHVGIRFEGLLYNSPELAHLRQILGEKLDVEIKVDESNLGSLYVISPRSGEAIRVPCLASDYAQGISLFQHQLFKKRKGVLADRGTNVDLLQAKQDLQEQISESMGRQSKRLGKRAARNLEDCRGLVKTLSQNKTEQKKLPTSNAQQIVTLEEEHFSPATATPRRHDAAGLSSDDQAFVPIYRKGRDLG